MLKIMIDNDNDDDDCQHNSTLILYILWFFLL